LNKPNNKPLLSICIPTYNRAEILDKSILSIVSQNEFNSEDVELVISDNASTDSTGEIVNKYLKNYNNILYFRNSENIYDKNFPTVIGLANGIFRKLCNDDMIFKDGTIDYLLTIIKNNINDKPVVFFLNCSLKNIRKDIYYTNDFNSFVRTVSFYSTWIGGFSIWEDDFEKIENKFEGCELNLWQTKVLFEVLEYKQNGLVNNEDLFFRKNITKRYIEFSPFNVFYVNYLDLYKKYLNILLQNNTYKYLKKHLLFYFFYNWLYNYNLNTETYITNKNEDLESQIKNVYIHENYYYFFKFKLKINVAKQKTKNYLKTKNIIKFILNIKRLVIN
jgi:glycosyltransferase involved in cell wall biosynthesis